MVTVHGINLTGVTVYGLNVLVVEVEVQDMVNLVLLEHILNHLLTLLTSTQFPSQ